MILIRGTLTTHHHIFIYVQVVMEMSFTKHIKSQ